MPMMIHGGGGGGYGGRRRRQTRVDSLGVRRHGRPRREAPGTSPGAGAAAAVAAAAAATAANSTGRAPFLLPSSRSLVNAS